MALQFGDVKKEYAKDVNLKPEDVKNIVDWVTKQPHLPKIHEKQAILFLKKCHYQVEAAKSTVETYFTTKTLWPEVFSKRSLMNQALNGLADSMIIHVLPKKTPNGSSIIFSKIFNSNVANYDITTLIKYFDMVVTLDLYQNESPSGYEFVVDLKELPHSYMNILKIGIVKKFFYYTQEIMPMVPFRGLHFYVPVPFVDEFKSVIKFTAAKTLLPFLFFHDSIDDLVKHIPIECLPEEYGGSIESTKSLQDKNRKELFKNTAFFEWESQQMADESKRTTDNKFVDNMIPL